MNYFNKAKEIFNDPKKKSLTMLVGYVVFFIFVFIFINSGSSSTPDYVVEKEVINEISSYEYIYIINNQDIINEITGTYNNNEDTFNYNGLNYIKKDDVIYFNGTPVNNLDFDIDKYKYQNIELLIKNSDSKTTYKDSKKIVYSMSANEYFMLLNEINNCANIDCTMIEISILVESNDYINNVIIDLSNYYGYKYNIEINYNNINKISTN